MDTVVRNVPRTSAEEVGVDFEETAIPSVVQVSTDEKWIRIALDADWIAVIRLVDQDSQPVVGEVRVFPGGSSPSLGQGTWNAELLGYKAEGVPEGGLPMTLLRQVRQGIVDETIGGLARVFSGLQVDLLRQISPEGREALQRVVEIVPSKKEARRRTPVHGKPDTFYAELARDYVDLIHSGSPRPNAEIAKRRKLKSPKVRDMIHEARKRGLLSTKAWGRPGGQLTPRALELLESTNKTGGKSGRKRKTKRS